MGIDPGSRYTGYGVVRKRGADLIYVASGRINAARAGELSARLPVIFEGLREIIEEFSPDESAVESIFFAKNAMSSLKLGHARGVSLLALQLAGIPLSEYPPTSVKQAVTGHGRADKDEVQQMVKLTLRLRGNLAEDASDALAVAICHCQVAGFADRLS
jgi:crossover junction endodeoxyribonuclease RuvC